VKRIIPSFVTDRQTMASNPDYSAWVSANAGSGKTHVLAQRVVRLLLSGVDPARILCITFTKAAAANMANRVFDELRQWAVLDDPALDAAMKKSGVKAIDAALRLSARQLFARALETPGGLKVQTIHAFCTQLLQLFPFEANVPASFEVLDEAAETQLLGKLTMQVLLEAAEAPQSALGKALVQAVLAAADTTFQDMVREAIGQRDALTRWVGEAGGVDEAIAQLSRALGVEPDETVEQVDAKLFNASIIPASEWAAVAVALDAGSKTDKEQAARFVSLANLDGNERVERYLDIFCTGDRKKCRENVVTAKIKKSNADLSARLDREQARVWTLLQKKNALQARDRSSALFTVAYAVITRLRAEKNRRGLLDYDDLIDKTLALLKNERAAWVHYKLDRGIHHVLIDEAQDTSPKQWEIVKSLVGEFFAGIGAHERTRTIFAVGDEKQSIFSFQGAAPQEFALSRRYFAEMHKRAEMQFEETEFKHSLRSGPNVLAAVDAVFSRIEAFAGLATDPVPPVHEALPDKAPGLVEIWDLETSETFEKTEGWQAPFDVRNVSSGNAKLAKRIAETVAAWRDQGRQAKDVLILLRRRGVLFEAIIRALKNAKIPVAGADRLLLGEHIAVMDLMVLADALLLPDDDLALATTLKSPLFGLDDGALFALAAGRKGRLYDAFLAQRPELAEAFDAVREQARDKSPFAFYAWLLGAQQGRRKFVSRLGHEANDALDEFLNLALDYEQNETPSLQGFIAWLRGAQTEVKRDMEMERDEVRVMTVHGAKGLEAPIVILADTTTPPQGFHPPRLLPLPGAKTPGAAQPLIWAARKDLDVGPMAAARAQALNDAGNEYRRLLYVAMTRAAEKLVVCGAQGEKKIPDGCWYELTRDALEAECSREPGDLPATEVLRYRKTTQGPERQPPQEDKKPPPVEAPHWLRRDAPAAPDTPRIVRPSSAQDDALNRPAAGADRAAALLRGTLMHRLLQSLPDVGAEHRAAIAQAFMSRAGKDLPEEDRHKLVAQALDLLTAPRFAALFGPGSRAEVPIVGRVTHDGQSVLVSGQVDRLAITDNEILIADYKTNRPVPRIAPASYRGQLALYRAVLGKLYPGRAVRAALIWTEAPEFMELSAAVLDEALAQVTSRVTLP